MAICIFPIFVMANAHSSGVVQAVALLTFLVCVAGFLETISPPLLVMITAQPPLQLASIPLLSAFFAFRKLDVKFSMIVPIRNHQVFRRVICFYTVNVMNVLAGLKMPSKFFPHDQSVLIYPAVLIHTGMFSGNHNADISIAAFRFSSLKTWMLVRVVSHENKMTLHASLDFPAPVFSYFFSAVMAFCEIARRVVRHSASVSFCVTDVKA